MSSIKVESSIEQKLYGKTRCIARRPDGTVFSDTETTNNILLTIRQPIVKLLGGAMTPSAQLPFINQIGFGTNSTPANNTQTGLISPVPSSRRLIAAAPVFSVDNLTVTFAVMYDLIEPDIDGVALKEACLYTTDGTAVARTVIGSHTKEPGLYFEFYWQIGYEA